MPIVSLDAKRNYDQMIGLKFKNEELSQYFIAAMFEAVKLNIDQSGAKVENEAVMILTRGATINFDRKIISLNEDFWVVMKEEGKSPYLCVFITEPNE